MQSCVHLTSRMTAMISGFLFSLPPSLLSMVLWGTQCGVVMCGGSVSITCDLLKADGGEGRFQLLTAYFKFGLHFSFLLYLCVPACSLKRFLVAARFGEVGEEGFGGLFEHVSFWENQLQNKLNHLRLSFFFRPCIMH